MALPHRDRYDSLNLLYDISRELVSALDLSIVLPRVLSRSLEIVEAGAASIIILNENGEPEDAAIIIDGKVHEDSVERLKSTLEEGLAGWVVQNRQSALVPDTSRDNRWVKRGYDSGKQQGPKSSLCAPLIARDQLVGVITFTHQETNHYNQEHLDLVQAIADQAAIAALNAQLYQASQRHANVMAILAETAADITSTLKLDEVFSRILQSTASALQAEAVLLGLIDKGTDDIVLEAVLGENSPRQVGHRLKIGDGIAGWVVEQGETAIVPDVAADDRFKVDSDITQNYPVLASAAAPISAKGEIVGVLQAVNPKDGFSQEDILLLKGISGLAGTAIQHARLFNEVQQAHARYRQLFEDSIDLIFISDWDGQILEANREAIELSRYSREDLQAMKIFHFVMVDWNVVGIDFKALRAGQRFTYESYLQPKGAASFPVEVHVHPVSIENQTGLQWIIRDTTELKKLEQIREDLTSMIYHDLRSPLANVVSGLDLIRSIVPAEYEIESIIQIGERSLNRVQRLVSSLLDTSRLQAGQKIVTKTPVVFQTLAAEAVETIRPAADASNFVIKINQPEEPLTVMVDTDMIRRVMINLLENALKFSPVGRQIEITIHQDGQEIFFAVKDEGRGISEEDQKNVFERFMRADGTAAKTKGLGLGLAFCKLAVEGHGGKIWVDSQLDNGSTFTFKLPTNQ
ncbi:MAG: GAF domain-containing protein [Anaerolineales bacterium]|nr:GAF domain-containing protein [Anaerolineales bacterium]